MTEGNTFFNEIIVDYSCQCSQYLCRIQYTRIRKFVYECTSTGRRNMVVPRNTWNGPVSMKTEQLWNGFCPVALAVAAAADDKDDRKSGSTCAVANTSGTGIFHGAAGREGAGLLALRAHLK
jgi:hypothetical protein